MLCVKTKVLPSKIHGLGLFADQFIKSGTLVWRFLAGFDQRFTHEQVATFPEMVQKYLAKHASFREGGLYLLCADEGNYFNHSRTPNVQSVKQDGETEMPVYSLKDISQGEELTENYSEYDKVGDESNLLRGIIKRYKLPDF